MRLTLHWLLAYVHDVLSPTDAEAMGRKVQESDLASGLIQRMRTITRKLRMTAPKVDAKGLAADANNVADYLDSTLPSERVGDFERVCLDSDMHLAEVASCHQILTLVVSKPAEVSDSLRQKIYAVGQVARLVNKSLANGHTAEKAPLQRGAAGTIPAVPKEQAGMETTATSAATVVSTADAATDLTTEKTVPSYLRKEPPSRLWPSLLGLAAGILIVGGILRAMGPFNSGHPVLGPLLKPRELAQVNTAEAPKTPTATEAKESKPSSEQKPAETNATPPATKPTEGEAEAAAPEDENPAAEMPAEPPAPVDEAKPAETSPSETKPGELPPETAIASAAPVGPPKPGDTTKPPVPAPSPAEPATETGAADVARLMSDQQVVARFDASKDLWMRVPVRGFLTAGERLVVLPTYRPQFALPSGVQITFYGESALQMQVPDKAGISRMNVAYGRLFAISQGTKGPKIDLNLSGLEGTATLARADSSLAIEVRPYLPPGGTPAGPGSQLGDGFVMVELQAIGGTVVWQEAGEGKEPFTIEPGMTRTYIGNQAPQSAGPFVAPDWIDNRHNPLFDQETSLAFEARLPKDRSLAIALEELLTDRRVEVRSLAAISLGAIYNFEPLFKELSDARQFSYWGTEVDSLRQAMARGPDSVAAVYAAIEKLHASEAKVFHRLCVSYGPQQLAEGGAKELVELLESPEMDLRVLASDNLRHITTAMHNYQPHKKADVNKKAVARWRERLKEGSIAWTSIPTPVPAHKAKGR